MLREDGERFLPWMADPVINYEHLHRYRAARDLAVGRVVLDMASGEGYGSSLLGEVAASVVGVDLDPKAVLHATAAYGRPGLRFVQGSVTELPLKAGQFDLIVCFEALEHLEEQERLCAEAARLLRPGGLFMVSTPNRKVYTEDSGYSNPFHVRELDLLEFTALVKCHFANVRMFGQHVYPVSALFGIGEEPAPAREYVIAREAGEPAFRFVTRERKTPRYFLCVASKTEFAHALGVDSFLVDASGQLFEVQRRAEGAVIELEKHLAARESQVLGLERDLTERTALLNARSAQAEGLDRLLKERGRQALELAETAESLRGEVARLQIPIARLQDTIARMESTLAWRLHLRARAVHKWARRLLRR